MADEFRARPAEGVRSRAGAHVHAPHGSPPLPRVLLLDGTSSTLLPGVVWAMGQEKSSLSSEQLDAALTLSGLSLDEPKRQVMLSSLNEQLDAARTIRELTRSGRDALLTQQDENDWPNFFRAAQLMPAVEHINANRARVLAMEGMARTFADVAVRRGEAAGGGPRLPGGHDLKRPALKARASDTP